MITEGRKDHSHKEVWNQRFCAQENVNSAVRCTQPTVSWKGVTWTPTHRARKGSIKAAQVSIFCSAHLCLLLSWTSVSNSPSADTSLETCSYLLEAIRIGKQEGCCDFSVEQGFVFHWGNHIHWKRPWLPCWCLLRYPLSAESITGSKVLLLQKALHGTEMTCLGHQMDLSKHNFMCLWTMGLWISCVKQLGESAIKVDVLGQLPRQLEAEENCTLCYHPNTFCILCFLSFSRKVCY